MADTNNNPAADRTGGPSVSSTGPVSGQDAPDSQKGSNANPTGQKVPDDNRASGPEGVPPEG